MDDPLHWTTFLHKKHSNYFKAISENVFQIVTLDGEENEPRKPSNTVRSLIPDTNNLESSNGIHNLAKKRRSFIPAEEYAEPEASKSESSVAPTVALTSGDSDDSESGLTGIRTLALISMFFVHNLQYNNDNFEKKQLLVQPPPYINSKRRKASCNFPTINYRKPFIHSCLFAISQIMKKLRKLRKEIARKPGRNHGDYKETRFLRTKNCESNMTTWTSKSSTSFDKNKSQFWEKNFSRSRPLRRSLKNILRRGSFIEWQTNIKLIEERIDSPKWCLNVWKHTLGCFYPV